MHGQLLRRSPQADSFMVEGSFQPDKESGELRWRDAGVVAAAAKRPVTFYPIHKEAREQSSSSERRLPATRLPNNPS
jgi:hypothetical protein